MPSNHLNTILTALRYYQENNSHPSQATAQNNSSHPRIDAAIIHSLCQSLNAGELVMLPSDSIRKVRDLLWRDVITADVFMTPSVPTSGDHTVPGTEDLFEMVLDALGLPSEQGARDLCYDLFYLEHCKNGQLKPAELLSALRQIAQDMT